jgi:hypothetical protein
MPCRGWCCNVRSESPFLASDLAELERLYEQATAVVAMEDIADGLTDAGAIGLRHDVDNVIAPAVQMAEWEAERGYRSTYFILHTAPYWEHKATLKAALAEIAHCGHEIGFHLNAITKAIETGRDPLEILYYDLGELRDYGYPVRGVVAHGDSACYQHNFVNDELFTESARPSYGTPDRVVGGVTLRPVSRATFGFDYDPNWLSRAQYLSDSGGRWSQPFERVAETYPFEGQLHILVHPDWWSEAFALEEAAA